MYDYLIEGSGLFGAVFAHEAKKDGSNVHKYGAHIFHTSYKDVWEYVNQFVEFNNYVNSPVANYKGELYNLPFNMNTFAKLWGIVTPDEAAAKIAEQRTAVKGEPQNLEEQRKRPAAWLCWDVM